MLNILGDYIVIRRSQNRKGENCWVLEAQIQGNPIFLMDTENCPSIYKEEEIIGKGTKGEGVLLYKNSEPRSVMSIEIEGEEVKISSQPILHSPAFGILDTDDV